MRSYVLILLLACVACKKSDNVLATSTAPIVQKIQIWEDHCVKDGDTLIADSNYTFGFVPLPPKTTTTSWDQYTVLISYSPNFTDTLPQFIGVQVFNYNGKNAPELNYLQFLPTLCSPKPIYWKIWFPDGHAVSETRKFWLVKP